MQSRSFHHWKCVIRWRSSEPFFLILPLKNKIFFKLKPLHLIWSFHSSTQFSTGVKAPGWWLMLVLPAPATACCVTSGKSLGFCQRRLSPRLSLFPVGAGRRILRELHLYPMWIFAGVSCVISCINKVTRPIMALTDWKPLIHESPVLVSSNKSCSSTLCFSEPRSNILLLLSQAPLMSCSEVGRWRLLSNGVRIDLSYCRFLHFARTGEQSNNCSSYEIWTA